MIEDIPIYNKRVNLIIYDRLKFAKCSCGNTREPIESFDHCLRRYVTYRYLDYVRIMGGKDPFDCEVYRLLCNLGSSEPIRYTEKKFIFELQSCGYRFYHVDSIVYNFMRVVNYLKVNYSNNTDRLYDDVDDKYFIEFALTCIKSKDILGNILERQHNKLMNDDGDYGDAYRKVVAGTSKKDMLGNRSDPDYLNRCFAVCGGASLYHAYSKFKENIIDSDGCYVLPKLGILKDGYDAYMAEVANFELDDLHDIGSMDDTDKGIVKSLGKLGLDFVDFQISHGIRCITLDDNSCKGDEHTRVEKYRAYVKNICIDGRTYSFKVLSLLRYTLGSDGNINRSVNKIRGVTVYNFEQGKAYSWDIRCVNYNRFSDCESQEYGFVDNNVSEHTVSKNMARAWVNSVTCKMRYIKHEVYEDELRVHVMYSGEEVRCIKCGSSNLSSRNMEYSIDAGELNGYRVKLIVINHKVFKCLEDGAVFSRKYSINLERF